MKENAFKEIHLLMGLPGSGKTTYYDRKMTDVSYERNGRRNYKPPKNADDERPYRGVSMEDLAVTGRMWTEEQYLDKFNKRVLETLKACFECETNLVIDSLLTTNDLLEKKLKSIHDCLDSVKSKYNKRWHDQISDITIKVIWFDVDREACVRNDTKRRQVGAEHSIRTMPYEKPPTALLEKYGAVLVKQPIYKIEDWRLFFRQGGIEVPLDGILESDSWVTGGEHWSYTGSRWAADKGDPVEPDILDSVLTAVCPTITYLQYKKLQPALKIEEYTLEDYYSNEERAKWVLNLEDLYNRMVREGIV